MLAESLNVVAPEVVLAVFAMAALMWGAYAGREVGSSVLWGSCVLLVLVGLWVGFQPEGARTAFDGSFVSDGFARFSKVLILFGAAAALALSHDYLVKAGLMKFEYPVLIVLSVVGMMTMVSAQDLIVLYLGLELQSLALYVVAAFRRDSLRSTEAGLKYFVLGALSSGLLLYGASLTYGFAGTTGFAGIAAAVRGGASRGGAGLRAGVPLRRDRLQGVGGAVPHVDARRLRGVADAGDGLLRHRAEGGGGGDVRAAALRRLRRGGGGLAADPGAPVGGVDVPRRGRGDRAAELQAADGLFLDQPHGLRADGAGGGDRAGGAVAADLSRDLRDDERRHLRLHPEHGARRQAGDRHLCARATTAGSSRRGRWRWRCCCSAWRGCRRWSASSGSSTC